MDRPDDDVEAADVRSERSFRGGTPAETRSREECWKALQATDGPDAGAESDGSGWDSVGAADRPPTDAIRVTPVRKTHILDGEPDGGGGHRHGTGKPGKTEFPASWDDAKVIDMILDVARRPDLPPQQQKNGRLMVRGTREDVEIVVITKRDGRIWTSWPLPGGPGVVKNPKEK